MSTSIPLPLEGVRVLDLSRVLAGPVCAMLLGDLGADVIKLEKPGSGDDTRAWGPPFLPGGESAYFMAANRNKRGIAVDLKSPRGRELLRELILASDIVIENFKRGTLEAWGFDETFFKTTAPRVVRATVSGYGPTGPRAGDPGYDFILQAESGLMSITGEPDGEPMKLGVAIVDLCTGFLTCIATLAALRGRDAHGHASHVEVNLHDTGIQLLANVASGVLATKGEADRLGNGHPNIVPYGSFKASDGWLAIAVGNDSQFARFAAALGHPEWSSGTFATNPERVRNRRVVDGEVGAVIATRTKQEWVEVLVDAGIPVGTIATISDAISTEHAKARGVVDAIQHVTAGWLDLLRPPIDVDGSPLAIRRAPPVLGQHTAEVLRENLGITESELDNLIGAAVVAVAHEDD